MAPSPQEPAAAPGVISLERGVPSLDLLPVEGLRRAYDAVLGERPGDALVYGDPAGHEGLRAWLADRLGHAPGAAEVVTTNGSLQALAFLLAEIVGPGTRILVEEPCYDASVALLARSGATLEVVPGDHEGIDVDAVERSLARGGRTVVYVIPTYHNPSGRVLSEERRRRLAALATEHDALVVEDDPYRELGFADGGPPTSLLSLAPGRVVHLSSFTKTVAPAVRCGGMVVPGPLHARLAERASREYVAPGRLAQAAVEAYVRSDAFEGDLARSRRALAERARALSDALDAAVGGRARWLVPAGGYFLWLEVDGVDGDALAAAARAEGLVIVAGRGFMLDGRPVEAVRLAFAAQPPEVMPEAARRLRRALDRC